MRWRASLAAALTAAAFGLVVAGAVANASVAWYRLSGFEGGAGYFIVLNALLGAVLGFIIGLVTSRALTSWTSSATYPKAAVIASAVVGAIGATVALSAWMLADIPPELQDKQLRLEVEFRLASGELTPPAEIGDPVFRLASVIDHMPRKTQLGDLRVAQARLEDGRWIVPASVFLFTSRGARAIEAQLGGETIGSYTVPLPAKPGSEFEQWSDWWPRSQKPAAAAPAPAPKFTGKKGAPQPPATAPARAKPPVDANPQYRFRVVRIGGGPPREIPASTEDQQAADERAAFATIPPQAPIDAWFPYTRYGASDEQRAIAIRNITAKPRFADELAGMMLADDNQIAAESLYLAARLSPPPAVLIAGVARAGQDIAARLDKLNALAADKQEEAYTQVTDISIRFAAWMQAVRSLRRSGADFTGELIAILERSRKRPDYEAIQHDVRRVASHFANEWAGIAPLTADPPR